MAKEKLKACPWCGWQSVASKITFSGGKANLYSFQCRHCGWESRRSHFKWRARRLWNRAKHPFYTVYRKQRRYHLYGREF